MTTPDSALAITLPNLQATDALAFSLAKSLTRGLVIYLQGELGVGKTTLVRAMLKALGYTGVTKSPTYTLVESYNLYAFTIHHFDLYRLADPVELEFIGIRDYVGGEVICVFEWPQKGLGFVPPADLTINLDLVDKHRNAVLTANTPLGKKVLAEIAASNI